MKKKLLIFEPWGLGDLAIATNAARILKQQYRISFICSQKWMEWLKSIDFIDEVVSFKAQWAEKKDKYNPLKYNVGDIFSIKSEIKRIQPEFIWDARGDIRHRLFLRLLSRNPVLSFSYPANLNVYKRLGVLLNHLKISIADDLNCTGKRTENISDYLVLFLGAYWKNKQVPIKKSKEIISSLLANGFKVKLILQPEDDELEWKSLVSLDKFQLIKADLVTCSKVISNARLVISTDSAWLHIAYYYGVKTIGLFGCLNADQWAPPTCHVIYASNSIPANLRYKFEYENIQPLTNISTEMIYEFVQHDY